MNPSIAEAIRVLRTGRKDKRHPNIGTGKLLRTYEQIADPAKFWTDMFDSVWEQCGGKVEEAFDGPLEYAVDVQTDSYFKAGFVTKGGVEFSVECERFTDENDDEESQMLGLGPTDTWEVTFGPIDYDEGQDRFAMTNDGNAQSTLATVAAILGEFVAKYRPDHVSFSASKGDKSRASVYTRMLKRLAPGYDVELDDGSEHVHFLMNKKESAVVGEHGIPGKSNHTPEGKDMKISESALTSYFNRDTFEVQKDGDKVTVWTADNDAYCDAASIYKGLGAQVGNLKDVEESGRFGIQFDLLQADYPAQNPGTDQIVQNQPKTPVPGVNKESRVGSAILRARGSLRRG